MMSLNEEHLSARLGREGYLKEIDVARRVFPEEACKDKVENLLLQHFRWEGTSSANRTNPFSYLNDPETIKYSEIRQKVHVDARGKVDEDQKMVRTLFLIDERMKESFDLKYVRKNRSDLIPTYAFMIVRNENETACYVKCRRLYKKEGKAIYKALDIINGLNYCVTQLPDNKDGWVELDFPSVAKTNECSSLVPPYRLKFATNKHQTPSIRKIMGVGELYRKNLAQVSLGNTIILKGLLAAARGERYLQSQGLSHRDIKPENIFVSTNNECFLGDYGFICRLNTVYSSGSPAYASPEAFLRKIITSKASVWEIGALGLVLLGVNPGEKNPVYSGKKDGNLTQETINEYLSGLCIVSKQPVVEEIFNLCTQCYRVRADERPDIGTVVQTLEGIQSRYSAFKEARVKPPKVKAKDGCGCVIS